MKGRISGDSLAPVLLLLSAMQQGVFAAEINHLSSKSYADVTTLQHVYVAGSDPSGRAAIGKALSRLGYVPSGSPDAAFSARPLIREGAEDKDKGKYSYTEITTPLENVDGLPAVFSSGADYVVSGQRRNQTNFEQELSVLGRDKDERDSTASWRRTVDSQDWEGEVLELSVDTAEALGIQAEKWVALCDFLGLGYSTVERLKLRQFP